MSIGKSQANTPMQPTPLPGPQDRWFLTKAFPIYQCGFQRCAADGHTVRPLGKLVGNPFFVNNSSARRAPVVPVSVVRVPVLLAWYERPWCRLPRGAGRDRVLDVVPMNARRAR